MLHSQIKNGQYTFTDGRFYAAESGAWVPSVTTILEAYPKSYQYLQWLKESGENADKIRGAAGKRGSVVHDLTEKYDNGVECNLLDENGWPQYSLQEWGFFERYIDFAKRFNPVNILIEQNVVSPELGFAGTMDRITEIEGKKYLLDIKTSNAIYASYWLQLAAYQKLYEQMAGKNDLAGVGILWLNAKTRTIGKKGDYQGVGWQMIIKEDYTKEWDLFKCTQKLWLAENPDAQPKQFSYQLKHIKSVSLTEQPV